MIIYLKIFVLQNILSMSLTFYASKNRTYENTCAEIFIHFNMKIRIWNILLLIEFALSFLSTLMIASNLMKNMEHAEIILKKYAFRNI